MEVAAGPSWPVPIRPGNPPRRPWPGADSTIGGDSQGLEILPEIGKPAVKAEAHLGLPAGKVGKFVLVGKSESQVDGGEADAGLTGRLFQVAAKKDVREGALPVQVSVVVDEVPEFPGLEAATTVPDPVRAAGFQHFGGPGRPDKVVPEKSRIPEVKIHGKAVDLDMHEKWGGKVPAQLQRLEPLALPQGGGSHLSPFPGVLERRTVGSQMNHGTKIDAGADMVQDPGRKVGILFGIVD